MAEAKTTRWLKPAADRKVRWPDGRVMDAEGEQTDVSDPYWTRKLNDVDVVEVPALKTKKDA
ncbi:DUF2635 domain-containing protein [Caulobacter sp. SLTY]|uniref:DUF2635 domain-containing protein n=1 Tax=Caulobacter sp. SLTY TaxID=2683262 RepID=UPI0014124403|nr:DUF2635 domain-containing protein [Caulobacter sp. SLTY]NBB17552.1 DUF2635 domain-containing protein [Caulobacter sp. SLTY]